MATSFTVNDPEGRIRERVDRIGKRFRESGIGGGKRPAVIGFALAFLEAHMSGDGDLAEAFLDALKARSQDGDDGLQFRPYP